MRARKKNRWLVLLALAAVLLWPVLPVLAGGPVAGGSVEAPTRVPVGEIRQDEQDVQAEAKPNGTGQVEQAGQTEGGQTVQAKTGQSEPDQGGRTSRTATGTVILIGAGAYTYARGKRKEKKKEGKPEYVYFENHTRNGTLRDEEKYNS